MTKKRGGKRNGAGRKLKYNEATTTMAFRVPTSKKPLLITEVKKLINQILKHKP